MHFTDTEIEEFEQIALHFTTELKDLDSVYERLGWAELELHDTCYFNRKFNKRYKTDDMLKVINECKKRIERMERFGIWLEQNYGI
ncbi:MAG: hypothetical protein CBC83_10025 [Flavobacteriales bacterium TMED123]|nr:MAG: hypothetical protein CBC83_10025 [Flavobacteriales bacterium TMED123]|tara:strand:+ start:1545 stop:1802 length:258 start_codon:yes stop_codon:yes gene_type:complete